MKPCLRSDKTIVQHFIPSFGKANFSGKVFNLIISTLMYRGFLFSLRSLH